MSNHLNLIGLLPLVLGLVFVALAKPYNSLMITYTERQLRLMRRPGFVWVYRVFGLVFVLSGISLLLFSE
jgi:threonine/homoserine/homoserine lactone efflux protein